MQNKRSMMDCIDLVNELGIPDGLCKAINYIDQNFDGAWTKHIDEIDLRLNDRRFVIDQQFRDETSTNHYNTLLGFIKKYKANATDSKEQFDSYFK